MSGNECKSLFGWVSGGRQERKRERSGIVSVEEELLDLYIIFPPESFIALMHYCNIAICKDVSKQTSKHDGTGGTIACLFACLLVCLFTILRSCLFAILQ